MSSYSPQPTLVTQLQNPTPDSWKWTAPQHSGSPSFFMETSYPAPRCLICRGRTHQGGRGVPWAQATSTVAVECFAPVSSSEVTCHWPLRDLVPRRVTPFLAFTLEEK